MPWLNLTVGAALLLFGRRLFWLFVAGSGFAVGLLLAADFLRQADPWVALAIELAAGLVGALLALFAQKLAVAVAGFLAGGYLGYSVVWSTQAGLAGWVAFVIGGVLGALLLAVLFEWALMGLSSLLGAALIARDLPLVRPWPTVVFVALVVVGWVVQARQRRPAKRVRADD